MVFPYLTSRFPRVLLRSLVLTHAHSVFKLRLHWLNLAIQLN